MVTASIPMAVYCFDVIYAVAHKEQVPQAPAEIPQNFEAPLFVTWKKGPKHDLRGCIGTFSNLRLDEGLAEYARISAFSDSRFNPVSLAEIPSLQCGVSILIRFEPTSNYRDWQVGVHGVRMNFNDGSRNRSAVFLPEVASEQGWSHIDTIDNLIHKSGYRGHIDEKLRNSLNIERFQSSKIVLDHKDYVKYKEGQ